MGVLFASLILAFVLPTEVEFIKLFRTMNRPRPLDLGRHSLPYMVDIIKRHEVNKDDINTSSYVSQISLVLRRDY